MELWNNRCDCVPHQLVAAQDAMLKQAEGHRTLLDSVRLGALVRETQDKNLAAFLAIQRQIAATFGAQPGPFPVSYLPRCQISLSTVRQRRGSR